MNKEFFAGLICALFYVNSVISISEVLKSKIGNIKKAKENLFFL